MRQQFDKLAGCALLAVSSLLAIITIFLPGGGCERRICTLAGYMQMASGGAHRSRSKLKYFSVGPQNQIGVAQGGREGVCGEAGRLPGMCVACLHSDRLSQNNNAKRGAGPLFRFQVNSCRDRFHREPTKPRGGQIRPQPELNPLEHRTVTPALEPRPLICISSKRSLDAGERKRQNEREVLVLVLTERDPVQRQREADAVTSSPPLIHLSHGIDLELESASHVQLQQQREQEVSSAPRVYQHPHSVTPHDRGRAHTVLTSTTPPSPPRDGLP
ncbi:hypothetical protein EYF80_006992 [Liparis tanakae]|uniref:Uncharacterized protein n=1 Tax=Liparis tanakae TaxID=230148 RepID=A0A4Z2IYA6_9TELE|nr:hypothetical protein EYF80_006992 [Liparis tanakae]